MTGMIGETWLLIRLEAALAVARLRRALGRGVLRPVAAGSADALVVALLAAGGASFALVSSLLLGELLRSGEARLAAGVAGWLADAAPLLAAVTLILSENARAAPTERVLALLPVRAGSRILAELVALCTVRPSAVVLWAVPLALMAGVARARSSAAVWLAPICGLLLVQAAAGALAFQRIVRLARARPGLGGRLLGGSLTFGPLFWLFGRLRPEALREGTSLPPLAGRWVGEAVRSAAAGRAAPAAAAALLASGLVFFVVASHAGGVPWDRAGSPRRPRPPWQWEPARLLAPGRAREQILHGLAGAVLLLLAGRVAAARLPSGGTIAAAALLLAVWVASTAAAPLSANLLGWGGRSGATVALLPVSGRRLLAAPAVTVAVASIGGAVSASILAAVLFDPLLAGRAGIAGLSAALAGTGAGALASVLWPRPARLDRHDDPLWGPDPARLLLPAAQGAAFAPAAAGAGIGSALLSVAIGVTILLLGTGLAGRRLDRARVRVAEELLT